MEDLHADDARRIDYPGSKYVYIYIYRERENNCVCLSMCVCLFLTPTHADPRTNDRYHSLRLTPTLRYNAIIAVSYEARALGVKRLGGQSGQAAKELCPSLVCVQVPVQYKKPNLGIYRDAGARVVAVLREHLPNMVLEKASIDEVRVYLCVCLSVCLCVYIF